jgi:glutamyl-tRNA synthetase
LDAKKRLHPQRVNSALSLSPDLLRPTPRNRPVGRYAPSPTGDLHLGNLRTALLAWQQIRNLGGIFILRIEDLDTPRNVPGAEQRIIADLRWLGLDWGEGPDVGGPAAPYRQSERSLIYETALEKLSALGLTYYCTCSRKDLQEASAPHGPEGPVYPGTCRDRKLRCEDLPPGGAAIRFRTGRAPLVSFTDEILGTQTFDLAQLCGDFVIRRRDGLWAYQLACAVDDALMGITHVLRGEDLLSSTPRQLAVIRALNLPEPAYSHVPLVLDASGRRMSKRDGSQSLQSLRSSGLSLDEARRRILCSPTSS